MSELQAGILQFDWQAYWQFDEAFDPSSYWEQSLRLDYQQEQMAWHMLGYWGSDGQDDWQQWQYAYGEWQGWRFGRLPRFDANGAYQLDGLSWQNQRWQFYIGRPHHIEQRWQADLDSDYLAGLQFNWRPNWQWGLRYYWSGEQRWLLDQALSGQSQGWQWWLNFSFDLNHGHWHDFAAQALYALSTVEQIIFSAQHYDPLKPAISFRDRFYQLYREGEYDALSLEYQRLKAQIRLSWHHQEQGADGWGLEINRSWSLNSSNRLEAHGDWWRMDGSDQIGLFLSYQWRPLAHCALELNAVWRYQEEQSIYGAELRGQWQWDANWRLQASLESLYQDEPDWQDDYQRISLTLSYQWQTGARSYR